MGVRPRLGSNLHMSADGSDDAASSPEGVEKSPGGGRSVYPCGAELENAIRKFADSSTFAKYPLKKGQTTASEAILDIKKIERFGELVQELGIIQSNLAFTRAQVREALANIYKDKKADWKMDSKDLRKEFTEGGELRLRSVFFLVSKAARKIPIPSWCAEMMGVATPEKKKKKPLRRLRKRRSTSTVGMMSCSAVTVDWRAKENKRWQSLQRWRASMNMILSRYTGQSSRMAAMDM